MATLSDLLSSVTGTQTGRGAALGALMSTLLSAYKPPGGVNIGVDMSKVGAMPGRTTSYTPRFVTAAEYGAREPTSLSVEARRALGVPLGISGLGPMSQYTARPTAAAMPSVSVSSPGSGSGVMPSTTLTPRGENTINPAVGGLLGAALGSLMPNPQATPAPSGGGGGSGSSSGVVDLISSNPYIKGVISDIGGFFFKEGGLATPLMADGGQASYYTYGTPVDPRDIMNQMSHGGTPKHGGLHVPTVEGRHDYRAGARVTGEGDGQSDDIPAMLADGEYVIDSETVAQLGNGSTKAGSDLLDKFREEIRAHKRSAPVDKIPPPSKSPLAYMKAAQKKVRSA